MNMEKNVNLPQIDLSPSDLLIGKAPLLERFFKKPLRRIFYPPFVQITTRYLSRRYQKKLPFNADLWLWGQRGNDYESNRRRVHDYLDLKNKRIMIAGCGTGRDITSWLQYRPAELIGVDYFNYKAAWDNLSEDFRRKFPETSVGFHQADLTDLSVFESNTFDVIGSDAVFEHIKELPVVLSEFQRLLKPGGLIYATFGPLWYCWQGDHYSGWDDLSSGYNHLILERGEYERYLNISSFTSHSEHDGRTWIKNNLFSYLEPIDYVEILQRSGLQKEFIALIIEPNAIKCLKKYDNIRNNLLGKHGEMDLIISGMSIIFKKPQD